MRPPMKGAIALALAMPLALTGCGTLPRSNVAGSPLCNALAAELAAAKTLQQQAETKEAGIAAGCWKRS